MATVKDMVNRLRFSLRPLYGERQTESMIRHIFHYVKGWNLTDMVIHEGDEVSEFISGEIEAIIDRLLKHEPLQYITGTARFHGHDFKVTGDVLIPRPETEELVDLIADDADGKEDLRVLDVGTGSGCIAISLARALKFPVVTATDISERALNVARENADLLGANITFIKSDILKEIPSGKFDIIVSNPPYIESFEKAFMERNVLDYEPSLALFVPDDDVLIFYRRLLEAGINNLKPGGKLYMEINPMHLDDIRKLAKKMGFETCEAIRDSYGKYRFVRAIK